MLKFANKFARTLKLAVVMSIALVALNSCKEDDNLLILSGELVEHSNCKNDIASEDDVSEHVDYSFDEATNKLTLKHTNAKFNCCLDFLYADISLVNDTILIKEVENLTVPCNCVCKYDLDMLITGVAAKKYTIKIEQHYIVFDVDLKETPNGSYTVD
jgi:hypothetical protein